jgi:hypothetical protein
MPLHAQIEGTLDLTATWSFNLETPGINARAYFFLNKYICFGPEFTYFFEKTTIGENDDITITNAFTFDFNSHYVFEVMEHHRLGIYPILGLNYTNEKETEHGETHLDEAFGLNLGAGFETPLSEKIHLFSEFIHTFSTIQDNVLFLGVNWKW